MCQWGGVARQTAEEGVRRVGFYAGAAAELGSDVVLSQLDRTRNFKNIIADVDNRIPRPDVTGACKSAREAVMNSAASIVVVCEVLSSYQRQMCRTRTRALVNLGEYPIFVLGPRSGLYVST